MIQLKHTKKNEVKTTEVLRNQSITIEVELFPSAMMIFFGFGLFAIIPANHAKIMKEKRGKLVTRLSLPCLIYN